MSGKADPKVFENAVAIKDGLTKQQAKDIAALYVEWAEQIGDLADYYAKKSAPSYSLERTYNSQLKKQVTEMSKQVANGVYSKTNANLHTVADAVVKDNAEWMKQFGLSSDVIDAAFSDIAQSTVNALVTGSVYGDAGTWSLSKAIWGDNEDTLKKIYQIVAQGSVMQMPTAKIAEKLEQFVNPGKQFKWNGPEGYPAIYGKKVDYSAQRLARTLVQHCYQETFVAVSKKNPLITQVRYIANGSRVCDVCKARNGKLYALSKVPLDHPNGMCVLEPVVNDSQVDNLAKWVKGDMPGKDLQWWDKKMQAYGYDVSKMASKAAAKTVSDVASEVIESDVQDVLAGAEAALKKVQKADAGNVKKAKKIAEKADEAAEQATKETKVEVAKAAGSSSELPSYKELLKQLQDKQKQSKQALDDLKKKYSSGKNAASDRFNRFIKNIAKHTDNDGSVHYLDVFYDTKGKFGDSGSATYIDFRNALYDVEFYNLKYTAEAECKKIANLYEALFGKNPEFIKPSEHIKHEYVMTGKCQDDMLSLVSNLFFKGDFDTLKKAGISDASLKKAKGIVNDFYGFDVDDIIEFGKLSSVLKESKNDIDQLKTTGFLNGVETDQAASIVEKAKEKAEALAKKMETELKIKQQAIAEKLKDFRKNVFAKDAYSDAVKSTARDFAERVEADAVLRPELDEIWGKLTDGEKFSIWKYTEGSGSFNRPLSGYANASWSRGSFKGVGNVSWNAEDDRKKLKGKSFIKKFAKDEAGHVDGAKAIADLTTAIDSSPLEKPIILSRGDGIEGLAGLLEGSDISYDKALELLKNEDIETLKKLCEGRQFQSHAFMSTTISSQATPFSISSKIRYRIYAPEGTHAVYAEPASFYGETVGMKEALYKVGMEARGVGSEAEIIVQRGSSFRIKSIEIDPKTSKIDIEMEIADQPDYFITGYEQTIDSGKSLVK